MKNPLRIFTLFVLLAMLITSGSLAAASIPTRASTTLLRSTASPTPISPVAFVDSGQDLGSGNSYCVALGDVDNDGDLDALINNEDQAGELWLNDGSGIFTRSSQSFDSSTCVVLGDLDGDNYLDAFFTQYGPNQVWLNDGTGRFRNTDQNLGNSDSEGVTLGDLDNDGDLDAFVAAWSGQPDKIWLNDGSGNFVDSGQNLGSSFSARVALGDVDQDGDLDAIVANNGVSKDNAVVLWLNDGKGNFVDSNQRLGYTNAYAVALGDLDGDGDLDAFVANSSHAGANPADKVWLNDGQGIFSDSGQNLGDSYSMDVALGDLDNDGDLDAFVGNYQEGAQVWLNDGNGSFVDSGLALGSSNSHSIALADLDSDGDLDAFVASDTWEGSSGSNKLWVNKTNE